MRKKIYAGLLLSVMVIALFGCKKDDEDTTETTEATVSETTESTDTTEITTEEEIKDKEVTVYQGDDNAEGVEGEKIVLDTLTPENVAKALKDNKILDSDVKVLSMEETTDGDGKKLLTLDLSKEFLTQINNNGTTGEEITIASIVNTYLNAYEADRIQILVEGDTWSSGHVDYEEPMEYFK